ncbi:MAG: TlpA family protein disulfide reductase [Anaerolineaceae bacterium]|nr:TlpA family protein disulfide reductase [Anaerolineaceae bacterium]
MDKNKQTNLIIISILLISFGWLVFTTWANFLDRNEKINSGLRPGFSAPEFNLPDQAGNSHALSDYQGKVVVLNFWASWCTYCKAEFPDLEKVYKDYIDEDFVVLAVNSTAQDKLEAAYAFLEKTEVTFPVFYDHKGEVIEQYQVMALPTTYIIDKQGIIQEVFVGGGVNELLLKGKVKDYLNR